MSMGQTPSQLDLPIIWRGCTWPVITLTWKDQNGNPFNLTGWTARAQSQNINLNPLITNAAQGITTLSLTATQTASLKLGVEEWDWVWSQNGTVYPPVLSGMVPIREPISQPPTT
jgi:hypothetical protein